MKYKLVPEEELKRLLANTHILKCLERDGVDNWSFYMKGQDEYIASELKRHYPWCNKTQEQVKKEVEKNYIIFDDLADLELNEFAEIDRENEV